MTAPRPGPETPDGPAAPADWLRASWANAVLETRRAADALLADRGAQAETVEALWAALWRVRRLDALGSAAHRHAAIWPASAARRAWRFVGVARDAATAASVVAEATHPRAPQAVQRALKRRAAEAHAAVQAWLTGRTWTGTLAILDTHVARLHPASAASEAAVARATGELTRSACDALDRAQAVATARRMRAARRALRTWANLRSEQGLPTSRPVATAVERLDRAWALRTTRAELKRLAVADAEVAQAAKRARKALKEPAGEATAAAQKALRGAAHVLETAATLAPQAGVRKIVDAVVAFDGGERRRRGQGNNAGGASGGAAGTTSRGAAGSTSGSAAGGNAGGASATTKSRSRESKSWAAP